MYCEQRVREPHLSYSVNTEAGAKLHTIDMYISTCSCRLYTLCDKLSKNFVIVMVHSLQVYSHSLNACTYMYVGVGRSLSTYLLS